MAANKDKARAILSYATPNPVGPYRLITPPSPDLGRKTQTPVMPVMGGALVNLPNPVKPTKQTTPVAPPMADKLVNVPKQQVRVVDKNKQMEPKDYERLPASDYLRRAYEEMLADFQSRHKYWGVAQDDDTLASDALTAVDHVEDNLRIARRAGFKGERAKRMAYEFPKIDQRDDTYNFFFDEALLRQKGKKTDELYPYVEALKVVTRGVQELSDAEFDTWLSLREGWSGTAKELLDAARSLSK